MGVRDLVVGAEALREEEERVDQLLRHVELGEVGAVRVLGEAHRDRVPCGVSNTVMVCLTLLWRV